MKIKIFHVTELFAKPTLVYSDRLPDLIHVGIASNFPDEIADCIFFYDKECDEYLFQI